MWSSAMSSSMFAIGGLRYREDVETHFMSRVKEADQLKHGGKVVSSMQKRDHNQLWQGLHNGKKSVLFLNMTPQRHLFCVCPSDKFDQFWAVNRRLMETLPGEDGFKHVPVRLFAGDEPLPDRLYKTTDSERTKLTLRDLIKEALPDRQPDDGESVGNEEGCVKRDSHLVLCSYSDDARDRTTERCTSSVAVRAPQLSGQLLVHLFRMIFMTYDLAFVEPTIR